MRHHAENKFAELLENARSESFNMEKFFSCAKTISKNNRYFAFIVILSVSYLVFRRFIPTKNEKINPYPELTHPALSH